MYHSHFNKTLEVGGQLVHPIIIGLRLSGIVIDYPVMDELKQGGVS